MLVPRRVRFTYPLCLRPGMANPVAHSVHCRHRCVNHATAPGALCHYGFGDVAWCLIRWTWYILLFQRQKNMFGERDLPSILAILDVACYMCRFSASMSGDEILLLEALHAVEAGGNVKFFFCWQCWMDSCLVVCKVSSHGILETFPEGAGTVIRFSGLLYLDSFGRCLTYTGKVLATFVTYRPQWKAIKLKLTHGPLSQIYLENGRWSISEQSLRALDCHMSRRNLSASAVVCILHDHFRP